MPQPITQNPLSGECGLIAVVNAMRWLFPEVFSNRTERDIALYQHLLRASPSDGHIASTLHNGIERIKIDLINGVEFVFGNWGQFAFFTEHHYPYQAEKPPSENVLWVVSYKSHFAVVAHLTSTAAILVDSMPGAGIHTIGLEDLYLNSRWTYVMERAYD